MAEKTNPWKAINFLNLAQRALENAKQYDVISKPEIEKHIEGIRDLIQKIFDNAE